MYIDKALAICKKFINHEDNSDLTDEEREAIKVIVEEYRNTQTRIKDYLTWS